MPTCATVSCGEADSCVMEGGCTVQRFGPQVAKIVAPSELRDDAPALNGTKQRASRDPHRIKRNRKALTRW